MEISEEIGSNEHLPENDIKFWLLVLAFGTPYLISFGFEGVNIQLIAPLWRFGTMSYPIFRFWPLGMLFTEIPFGLIRLAFIQQVLLYKKNVTDSGKLVIVGILCELPGPILYNVVGVFGWSLPFPLFLIVGLLFAKYATKDQLSWIEKEPSAY